MTMRSPYRVAVWGPGDLGCIAIREIGRMPELELVAVYAYSEHKDGVDAGVLAGIAPLGVKATRDLEMFLAADAEVVLHTARDVMDGSAIGDFTALLGAGKNVITSQPYNYLPARDPAIREALTGAAENGNATFFASGINPGFAVERWALTMSGLSNDVQQIKLQEFYDCAQQNNAGTLQLIGLGGDPADAMRPDNIALAFQRHYFVQLIEFVGAKLGVTYSRIEGRCNSQPAPEDLHSDVLDVAAGRTGLVSYEWTGYVGDEPFFVFEVNWYLTEAMRPEGVTTADRWVVSIEGRPSLTCALDISGSVWHDLERTAGEPAAPGYVATVVPILRAIPTVVDAPAGVLEVGVPADHWTADLRRFAAQPECASR